MPDFATQSLARTGICICYASPSAQLIRREEKSANVRFGNCCSASGLVLGRFCGFCGFGREPQAELIGLVRLLQRNILFHQVFARAH